MAKKAKGNRVQVILECTEHKASGMPGTSRYITTKNRKNTRLRLFGVPGGGMSTSTDCTWAEVWPTVLYISSIKAI